MHLRLLLRHPHTALPEEALLDFIETNFRSTIELDATSGVKVIGELFWSMRGNFPLGHVAGACRHRPGYAEAVACLADTEMRVTLRLSASAALRRGGDIVHTRCIRAGMRPPPGTPAFWHP